ncbi:MAG TPA: hypothetical protein VE546_17435, partial [Streptomyces sp.]|nr:hypothetical protein [Streptomyces sp.]
MAIPGPENDRRPPRAAGLLPAAGGGRRLGGRPTALLPHRGRPLVEHAARALRGLRPGARGARGGRPPGCATGPPCRAASCWTTAGGGHGLVGSSRRVGLAPPAAPGAGAVAVPPADRPGTSAPHASFSRPPRPCSAESGSRIPVSRAARAPSAR